MKMFEPSMLTRIMDISQKGERLAIGLMSGTSVDGVDAALVKIKGSGLQTDITLEGFLSFPYPDGLKEVVLENSTPGQGSVDGLCRLNVLLGEIFAHASQALLKAAGVSPEQVDFIGSHGQTVQHLPEKEKQFGYDIQATLQIAEPAVIARRTGILTVADFRPADLALGGQGAPLVPYFDYLLFRSDVKNRALLNIGGISNFTVLIKNGTVNDVIAYDTGPGNMVLDWLMQALLKKPFDESGKTAQSGQISEPLLKTALLHPYFAKRPPKSTGREEFGEVFSKTFLKEAQKLNLSVEDTIATAAQLTIEGVWHSYESDVKPAVQIDEWIISGGGAKNKFLLAQLGKRAAPAQVKIIDDLGLSSDAKEAVCFAVLANETLMGNCNNVPSATGAAKQTILGKICF